MIVQPQQSIQQEPFEQITAEILSLSTAMLDAIASSNVQSISQLLLKRGNLLQEVKQFSLETVSPEWQGQVVQNIAAIQQLEPQIQGGLLTLGGTYKEQLAQIRRSKTTLHHYRQPDDSKAAFTRNNQG